MRVCVSATLLVIMFAIPEATMSGSGLTATATIQATAQVVPPVGVEAYRELGPSDGPADGPSFWIHAPRPGATYVTLTDASGRPVCLTSLTALSVLEQHRYRSLLCLDPGVATGDEELTLTVIYSAD